MLRALEKDEEAGDVARVWTAPVGSMGDSLGPSQERRARCHHVGAHYRTSCLECQLDQLFFVTQQGGVLV